MVLSLDEQLAALPPDVKTMLEHHRFDAARFKQLAGRLASESAQDNFVKGTLSGPHEEDLMQLPAPGSPEHERLRELGANALREGQVALLVLAGGMATRMGGVIKALVDAIPGKSFLDLRRAEMRALERQYGAAPPLWLMTSHSTDAGIRAALGDDLDGQSVATFTQRLSLRLTPAGNVFFDKKGQPSEHAPGHGDLPDALRESGLLGAFVKRGGKVVVVSNIDNMGGTLDPVAIGFHLAHGKPVTAEVVDKLPTDRGGIPVYVDGTLAILEEFRVPPSFDPSTVHVFATNVFYFDAPSLLALDMNWTYFTVHKKVDGEPVVQFERLVNEVTSALPTAYVHMPRTGVASRFLPVKDNDELALREPEILAVARARGILS
jgi:UTP--glucose-1-phosphate uridylyltransferase